MNAHSPDLAQLGLLGAIAGFTIFLGLPLAFVRQKPRMRTFFNALSAGILVFLLIEIGYKALEIVEESAKSAAIGAFSTQPFFMGGLLVIGLTVGLLGLTWFEERFEATGDQPEHVRGKRLSLMIAIGIGLHNFSEGLVIGQEFANGAISLATLLVAGFALHNATEGFGIVAPLKRGTVDWRFLLMVGFIGGAPTFIGTLAGAFYTSKGLELFFLSLAAGSILYVVGELTHIGKKSGQHSIAMVGILVGFFLAFGSELVIEVSGAVLANQQQASRTIEVETSEFKFNPSTLVVSEGDTVHFKVHNAGKLEHEFELPDLAIEGLIPPGKTVNLTTKPLEAGNYKLQCDMPGHLAAGMHGMLLVESKEK